MRMIAFLLLLMPNYGFSQRTMHDYLQESCDVVWFGLDFSQAKMIGEEGFNDPEAIKDEYFKKWNHLMINEGEKYDWQKALVVTDLKYDYEVIDVVNASIKIKSLVINRSHSISEEDIGRSIKQYDLNNYKDGIGVVMVVESFDKVRELGTAYIAFFDIATKQLLYTHRVVGEAGGIGFRNYWAGAIHNWMKYVRGAVRKDIRKEYK